MIKALGNGGVCGPGTVFINGTCMSIKPAENDDLEISVNMALSNVMLATETGFPMIAPKATYIPPEKWKEIISMAQTIYSKITASGGMTGLGGLGSFGELTWSQQYGPIILQSVGALATIIGNSWQQQVTRESVNTTAQSQYGVTVPKGGTQADADALVPGLMREQNLTREEAQALANHLVLGTSLPSWFRSKTSPSGLPSWLLPAGAAFLAYTMLRGRAK